MLSIEEARTIIYTLQNIPQFSLIKKTMDALRIYADHLEKQPETKQDPKTIRERIMIPLMKNFIYIFSLADDELYNLIEETQDRYVKEGIKQRELIPMLLKVIVNRSIQRRTSHA